MGLNQYNFSGEASIKCVNGFERDSFQGIGAENIKAMPKWRIVNYFLTKVHNLRPTNDASQKLFTPYPQSPNQSHL